jgi:hypothetical protein
MTTTHYWKNRHFVPVGNPHLYRISNRYKSSGTNERTHLYRVVTSPGTIVFYTVSLILPSFYSFFSFLFFSFLFYVSYISSTNYNKIQLIHLTKIITRFTIVYLQESSHKSQSRINKITSISHIFHKINTKIITSSQNHQTVPPGLHSRPPRWRPPACAPLVQSLPVLQGE